MAYCGPRGIPYTEFLGRGDRWDDLSREAALAWSIDDRTRCTGCGQDRDDWYEHDDEGNVIVDEDGYPKVAVPFRYEVAATYCPACHALDASTPKDTPRDPWLHPHFAERAALHPASGASTEGPLPS